MDRKTEYISIIDLSFDNIGQIIDNMKKDNSIVYVTKNDVPKAVMITVEEYEKYQEFLKQRSELVKRLSGSLSAYKDPSKIGKEREFYIQGLCEKYGRKDN